MSLPLKRFPILGYRAVAGLKRRVNEKLVTLTSIDDQYDLNLLRY